MTGTCESCVHWQPLAYDEEDRRGFGYGGIPTGDDGRWGVCQMVGEGAGVYRKDFEPEKTRRAFTRDASDYRSWLTTRADFGCVEHAPSGSVGTQ